VAEQGKAGKRENTLRLRAWVRRIREQISNWIQRNWRTILLISIFIPAVFFTVLLLPIPSYPYLLKIAIVVMVIILTSFEIGLIYQRLRRVSRQLEQSVIPIAVLTLITVIIIIFTPVFLTKDLSIELPPVDASLSIYWLQHCYGINYYWWLNYVNTTETREMLIQYFNQLGISLNKTMIHSVITQIQNLTSNMQYFSKISKSKYFIFTLAMILLTLFVFLIIILLMGNYVAFNILTCMGIIRNDLCINVLNWFFWSHFLKWFLFYVVTFSLIIYFSLISLITSEGYISLVLMIVTTFLVIITEFFVSREDTTSRENIARGPFMGPLVASIIAAALFTLMVFMIANVFLPSTCFAIVSNTNIGSLMNSIAPYYASLLILAAIFGAIPYASTLWAIQYHYECSCPPAKKQGEQWSSAGGSKLLEEM